MAILTQKITGLDNVNFLFKGAVTAGRKYQNMAEGLYLHGLTLIFTSPVVETVTFVASPAGTQVPIPLTTVLAQIKAQTTGVNAQMKEGQIVLVEATPASGVGVNKTGTANAALGLDTTAVTAGIVYNVPGGGAPELIDIHPIDANVFLVTTEEA